MVNESSSKFKQTLVVLVNEKEAHGPQCSPEKQGISFSVSSAHYYTDSLVFNILDEYPRKRG